MILASVIGESILGFPSSTLKYHRLGCKSPLTSSSGSALQAISKKAEMYVKVKRLKQMIAEGKGYEEYIDEKKRYEKQDPSLRDTSKEEGEESAEGEWGGSAATERADNQLEEQPPDLFVVPSVYIITRVP